MFGLFDNTTHINGANNSQSSHWQNLIMTRICFIFAMFVGLLSFTLDVLSVVRVEQMRVAFH
jgi:hypothetical protein